MQLTITTLEAAVDTLKQVKTVLVSLERTATEVLGLPQLLLAHQVVMPVVAAAVFITPALLEPEARAEEAMAAIAARQDLLVL
jgi:uncharacterized protein (DUF2236 family)